ncbi:MAG TPA: PilZ domain-containing protein, partial [Candidatus Eisenbacteria bacterium]
ARERRKAPRVVAKLAMQVSELRDEASVVTTESVNLSSSGLQFQSRAFLPPLTKVALTLLLPPFGRLRRERLVRCEGVIVRCEEAMRALKRPRYHLACYFTDVAEEDRTLVEQYVAWRALRSLSGRAPAGPPARTRRYPAAS